MINNSNIPLVSICMITYNHELYIKQAIESIIMQDTNFQFELIIGDDCSSDNTIQICESYKERYPWIKLHKAASNYGVIKNFIRTLHLCKGKYIALCEGDDYWVDRNKLQLQIDFLEDKAEYSMVFTDYSVVDSKNRPLSVDSLPSFMKKELTLFDILDFHIPPTRTIVYRKSDKIFKTSLVTNFFGGDVFICAILLENSRAAYIDLKSAVWRIHDNGVYSMIPEISKRLNIINDAKNLKKIFNKYKYLRRLNLTISRQYINLYCLYFSEREFKNFIKSFFILLFYDIILLKINLLKANYLLIYQIFK
jgi:glycosyltransferase involved in cell wall biosynthesis